MYNLPECQYLMTYLKNMLNMILIYNLNDSSSNVVYISQFSKKINQKVTYI